jgi:competence protein ComEC
VELRGRLAAIILGIFAIIFLGAGFLMLREESSDQLTLAFLDVGQGDAVLISKPRQYDLLIDGGPDPIVLSRLSDILPWYDREIDVIFLTHNHADHYQGLLAVLDKYKVGELIVSALAEPLPAPLLDSLKRHKLSYTKMPAGTQLQLDQTTKLKALWPVAETPIADMNDRSLVLELVSGERKVWLAGDAGVAVEEALLKNNLVEDVDIFKLSHHGSDTANSEEFLELLRPEWVVAQAGAGNSFGHPNRRIIKRAERVGAQILRNDERGTVVFQTDGREWSYEASK